MELKYLNKYILNKEKFIDNCCTGEKYETDINNIIIDNCCGKITVKQTFIYTLSNDFILKNLEKLLNNGVLKIKDKKGENNE